MAIYTLNYGIFFWVYLLRYRKGWIPPIVFEFKGFSVQRYIGYPQSNHSRFGSVVKVFIS